MSTKIYAGYDITNAVTSSRDLGSFVQKIRTKLKKVAIIEDAKIAAMMAAEFIDNYSVGKLDSQESETDTKTSLLSYVSRKIKDRRDSIAKTSRRDPGVDLGFELAIFFVEKKCLAIIFTENEALTRSFSLTKGVEYFGYWDSTDRPEDVSKSEWSNRRRLWDKAIPSGRPVDSCLSAMVIDNQTTLVGGNVELVLKEQPSFISRLEKIAKVVLMDESFERLKKVDVEPFSTYRKALDYVNSEAGQPDLSQKKAELETVLKRAFTAEDFLTSYPKKFVR